MKQQLTKVEIKIYGGTFPFQNNLSMYAEILQDLEMKAKISDINLGAKEAWYHRICRSRYQHRAERGGSVWHQSRNLHSEVFSVIYEFVCNHVLNQQGAYLSSDVNKLYHSLMIEKGVEECEISYTTQKLEERLIWMCPVTMKVNLKTKLGM